MIFAATPDTRTAAAKARIYGAALKLFADKGGDALTVSELAETAGIARGTIYNNISEPENLFCEIAGALAHEMIWRTEASMEHLQDPVMRLATGVRLFIRRAHEERDWGRFLVRFALAHTALQSLMAEPPAYDIRRAIEQDRFKTDLANVPVLITMLNGATLAAMNAVINGEQTWRTAGSLTAEFFLRAGGLGRVEARKISRTELPPLSATPLEKPAKTKARTSARERH